MRGRLATAVAGIAATGIAVAGAAAGSAAAAAAAPTAKVPAVAPDGAAVTIRILEHEAPRRLEVVPSRGKPVRLEASVGGLLIDGASSSAWSGPDAKWRITVDGSAAIREYDGALAVHVNDGVLDVVLRMPMERYVARVVASESDPGTPRAALEALAIVVRSWALSSQPRHDDARFCDLAHCQLLRGRGLAPRLEDDAQAAATATQGRVLRLPDGRVANATFHAACGGHTADPREVFGPTDDSGAAAVADPGCPVARWSARIPRATWERVARSLLPRDTPPFAAEELVLVRGRGGSVVQIVGPGDVRAAGDAFARALDAAMGFGVVRSARFEARIVGDEVLLLGSGLGHGVGLCQAGASLRARHGEDAAAILAHYFPHARLDPAS